jgi:CHAT domain-containing protein
VRGFLAAGATSLLVSLWSTNDESTAEMMGRFYQLWHSEDSGSLDKVGALRRVQLEALARRPHPASWAPFVLVGKP